MDFILAIEAYLRWHDADAQAADATSDAAADAIVNAGDTPITPPPSVPADRDGRPA